MDELRERIVTAAIDDLTNRKAIRQLFDRLAEDEAVWRDIRETLGEAMMAEIGRTHAVVPKEPAIWWEPGDPEQGYSDPDAIIDDYPEFEIAELATAYHGPTRWAFWHHTAGGGCERLVFDTEAEAIAAIDARKAATPPASTGGGEGG